MTILLMIVDSDIGLTIGKSVKSGKGNAQIFT